MSLQRMPHAEVAIDAGLVRTLLREQHEDLASLPLVESGEGWDNKLFRMRVPGEIEPEAIVESGRVDDERIALEMAD